MLDFEFIFHNKFKLNVETFELFVLKCEVLPGAVEMFLNLSLFLRMTIVSKYEDFLDVIIIFNNVIKNTENTIGVLCLYVIQNIILKLYTLIHIIIQKEIFINEQTVMK